MTAARSSIQACSPGVGGCALSRSAISWLTRARSPPEKRWATLDAAEMPKPSDSAMRKAGSWSDDQLRQKVGVFQYSLG